MTEKPIDRMRQAKELGRVAPKNNKLRPNTSKVMCAAKPSKYYYVPEGTNMDDEDIECSLCGGCLIERSHAMSNCPGPTNTSERVAPAPRGGQDVEQQTKEQIVQLPEQVKGQSKS